MTSEQGTDLPSPWQRRLNKATELGFRAGLVSGFKAGIWFSVMLWFITMGIWWAYAYFTQ